MGEPSMYEVYFYDLRYDAHDSPCSNYTRDTLDEARSLARQLARTDSVNGHIDSGYQGYAVRPVGPYRREACR